VGCLDDLLTFQVRKFPGRADRNGADARAVGEAEGEGRLEFSSISTEPSSALRVALRNHLEGRMAAKKKAAKKTARKKAAKRELIEPRGDARYVRRGKGGKFKESDDVGRSLAADRRTRAKKAAKAGQGDRGDRKR
jgi:hypothetical protein